MASFKNLFLPLLVIAWTQYAEGNISEETVTQQSQSGHYAKMHGSYDGVGATNDADGLVSYSEIKRALGTTLEEEWNKEIEPFDVNGDKMLTPTEFENWLTSFKKEEL